MEIPRIEDDTEVPQISKTTLEQIQRIVRAEMFATTQMAQLDNKLRGLKVRMTRAQKSKNKRFWYCLEQRRRVTQGVRNIMHKIVQKKKIQCARLIIKNFMATAMPAIRERLGHISQAAAGTSGDASRTSGNVADDFPQIDDGDSGDSEGSSQLQTQSEHS